MLFFPPVTHPWSMERNTSRVSKYNFTCVRKTNFLFKFNTHPLQSSALIKQKFPFLINTKQKLLLHEVNKPYWGYYGLTTKIERKICRKKSFQRKFLFPFKLTKLGQWPGVEDGNPITTLTTRNNENRKKDYGQA